ncbi:13418_t:CDS:2 [Entrophospora sp. SA101]|nr:13418_t:CDS:2 [Entrophospora sp. SA101]
MQYHCFLGHVLNYLIDIRRAINFMEPSLLIIAGIIPLDNEEQEDEINEEILDSLDQIEEEDVIVSSTTIPITIVSINETAALNSLGQNNAQIDSDESKDFFLEKIESYSIYSNFDTN